MGVRGLQFFLERCCTSASPTVNIEELASRKRTGNEKLIIVLDGSSCVRILYNDLEWIGGAQLNQFADRVRNFVRAFEEIGVKLVVFFDGPTVEQKRSTWIERRLKTLDKIYHVLDKISHGTPSSQINRKQYFHLPPGMGQLSRVLFEQLCGCEVYQSITECDEEIAEYARRNDVFAVLSQDSDYVIMDMGEALYLSMDHLDIERMTTLLYDRWELARRLQIQPHLLPLLATLMGNDIIPFTDLEQFHRRLLHYRFPGGRIDFQKLVPNIALFIRRLPYGLSDDDLCHEVSKQVFGNPDREQDIRTSLRSYTEQSTIGPWRRDGGWNHSGSRTNKCIDRGDITAWGQLVALARCKHQLNQLPSMVYAIMNELPFESSTSVEDFRIDDLPTFARVTQPIRERVYGILLWEKPLPRTGRHTVPEWCMAGPHSLDEIRHVPAVPPRGGHPGLRVLWDGEPDTLSLRWSLLVTSVSSRLDVDRLRYHLPQHLLVPTLIMYFLREADCLYDWEIEAALVTAALLPHYRSRDLSALPADPMTSRSVRVANLYMRSTFVIYFLQAACGYPVTVTQTAPWRFFDGKLFQEKYRQKQSQLNMSNSTKTQLSFCEQRRDVYDDFRLARSIVFNE